MDGPIVCTYRYTDHKFHGACERYGISVGPFIGRDQAEAAVIAEVRKQIVIHDETCFRHLATESA